MYLTLLTQYGFCKCRILEKEKGTFSHIDSKKVSEVVGTQR